MYPRLPRGEETLPIIEVEGRFLTLEEVRRLHPEQYRKLLELKPLELEVSLELLTERFRRRLAQGRVATIYRLERFPPLTLTPEDQLRHIELRDEIGLELLEAEREWLEETLRLLGR